MLTAKLVTDTLGQFASCQQLISLHHFALGMDPVGFYRVEPGAFGGQGAGQNPYPPSFSFDLTVVLLNPALHFLAKVPGGIVPHQERGLLAQSLQLATDPRQESGGHPTDGATLHKPPRHSSIGPGVQAGAGQPAKPTLVLEPQDPVRMGGRQPNQPVPSPFFRAYAGSGLVIHALARCQRTPKRARVARIVSPLTCSGVNPCRKLTSAANSRVHRLVGWSKVRGLWCSKVRNWSAFSPGKAVRVVWGREEPWLRATRPAWWKVQIALRTVWASQPKWWAIWGASSPLALARRIWKRRRMKASDERNPASNCWRSASVMGRTKMGLFITHRITHNLRPILSVH